ncbi:hypothetical protein Btru_039156 [Bulinus truncatus]|nr:hypothetical protein Btru_039156 [Bulinus truncatus]
MTLTEQSTTTVMTTDWTVPSVDSPGLVIFDTAVSVKIWFVVIGIAGTTVSTFGIIVNILSLGVLASSETRSTASFYLIAMASNDLLYLMNTLCFRCLEHLYSGLTGSEILFDYFSYKSLPYYYSVESITLTWAVYTIVMMSVDRAICLTRPLEWKNICSRDRVQKALVIVWSVMVLVNVPMLMQFKWIIVRNEVTSESVIDVEGTEFSRSFFFNKVYMRYIYPFFDSLAPIIIIGASNVVIAVTLNRRHVVRQALTQVCCQANKEKTYRITAMVLSISIQVLLTQSVKVMFLVVSGIHDTRMFEKLPVYGAAFAAFARFFSLLMATSNSLLFFYFGKKYRTVFRQKYGCRRYVVDMLKKRKEIKAKLTILS